MFSYPASCLGPTPNDLDSKAAQELVRDTVAHEVATSDKGSTKLMYLSRKRSSQGVETKVYVETTDATVGLIVARNNRPISDQERRQETEKLERMCKNGSELRRKQRLEREEAEHAARIVKALPDAFLYDYDGTEPAKAGLGKAGDDLVRLKFRPNPSYSPPSHVEQLLAGMHGVLLIDKQARRIARIDATLFKEVSFGWGIFGHLDKGGTFLVDQAEVAANDWELTHMRLNLTGKVMMVKSLVVKSEETNSEFRVVPSTTDFAQGVELLKAEEQRLQKPEPARTALNQPSR